MAMISDYMKSRFSRGSQRRPSMFTGEDLVAQDAEPNLYAMGDSPAKVAYSQSPEKKLSGTGHIIKDELDSKTPMSVPDDSADIPNNTNQKRSLFGDFFKSKSYGGGLSSDNIPLPERHEHSTARKILDVALPTLFGLAGGAGIIPGLITGLGAEEMSSEGGYQNSLKNYMAQKKMKEDSDYKTTQTDLAKSRLDEDKRHHEADEGRPRSDFDSYQQALKEVQEAFRKGLPPPPIARQTIETYKAKNFIQ